MKAQRHNNDDAAERRMDELLERAHQRVWPGADRSPRVEEHLRGIAMETRPKFTVSRSVLLLVGVGVLAGGSLAAAVTHNILSRRAVLVTDDGTRYEVELLESADGASGTFVTDDGTEFGIEMIEEGDGQRVSVDVNSPNGGTSTVILEDGTSPRVTTLPGQTARITIGTSDARDEGDEGEEGDVGEESADDSADGSGG